MRRLFAVLVVLSLVVTGCGGNSPDDVASERGIPALTEPGGGKDEPSAGRRDGKGRGAAKKGPGGRPGKGAAKTSNDNGEVPASGGGDGSGPAGTDGGSSTGTSRARPAAPIPAGTYAYATQGQRTVSGSTEDMPETTTLTADGPHAREQRQIRDLRDRDGNGTVTETHLVYRDEGVFLTYVKVSARFPGGLTDVREFRLPTPELVAPTGGGPGFSRSFTMRGSGTRADVAIRAGRYDKIDISGSQVRALIVDTSIVFSGALEGRQDSTSWFWPQHVMVVKEQVENDVRNGPIRVQSRYEAVLKQLP
ncbi:MAG: hypothetical protein ABR575_11110 [Actinomycetota bacterium]